MNLYKKNAFKKNAIMHCVRSVTLIGIKIIIDSINCCM